MVDIFEFKHLRAKLSILNNNLVGVSHFSSFCIRKLLLFGSLDTLHLNTLWETSGFQKALYQHVDTAT